MNEVFLFNKSSWLSKPSCTPHFPGRVATFDRKHLPQANVHARCNEDIKNLAKDFWPGDVKIPGSDSKSALDISIYDPNRLYRSANAAKCPEPPLYQAVAFHLVTNNPWDENDNLSDVPVADADLVAAERSLVTLVDAASSTLIPDRYNEAVLVAAPNTSGGGKPKSGRSGGGGGGGARALNGCATEAPSSHVIGSLTLALVSLHPQEGGAHAGWRRDLCVIFNTTRCPPPTRNPGPAIHTTTLSTWLPEGVTRALLP